MKNMECDQELRPNPSYMKDIQCMLDDNTRIDPHKRGRLINWLFNRSIHGSQFIPFGIKTIFLAVNIIDRYLSKTYISHKRLLLVGVASMFIACKLEEVQIAEVKQFERVSTCSPSDILDMELQILTKLNFNVYAPNTMLFFDHISLSLDDKSKSLATYIIELSLVCYDMLQFKPSLIAATAVYMAKGIDFISQFRDMYTEEDMKMCARELSKLIAIRIDEKNPYYEVKKKYYNSVE